MIEKSRKSTFHFLSQSNFLLLWSGQAISGFGNLIASMTIVLWITTRVAQGKSWAPLAIGCVWLMSAIPALLLGPLAGVFADRWDKRQTLVRVNALNGILTVFLFLCVDIIPFSTLFGGQTAVGWQLSMVYIILFLMSVCNQLHNPALFALLSDIIEETDRAQAVGLQEMMSNFNALLGPSLGTLLFFSSGEAWALLLDALSFGVLCLCLLAITLPQTIQAQKDIMPQEHFFQDFLNGLRFYKENRRLITILVACSLLFLGAGAHNALDIFFVTQNLHMYAGFYGFLSSSYALGLISGSLLGSMYIQRIGNIRAFWGGIFLWGGLMLIYARLENSTIAIVVVLLLEFSNAIFNVAVAPIILGITPREFIGRVISVFTTAMTIASLLSISLSSFFASTVLHNFRATIVGIPFSSIDIIFTCAGIFAIIGGWYAMVNLRDSTPKVND